MPFDQLLCFVLLPFILKLQSRITFIQSEFEFSPQFGVFLLFKELVVSSIEFCRLIEDPGSHDLLTEISVLPIQMSRWGSAPDLMSANCNLLWVIFQLNHFLFLFVIDTHILRRDY
jgi:hypothetical protein